MRNIMSLVAVVAAAAAHPGNAHAAEPKELPRCEKALKIIHVAPSQSEIMHRPAGRVVVEFNVDVLGYVSDPLVVESSNSRLNDEALKSVVLWRYAAPARECRHQISITYQSKDAGDA
jgi:TonB family protein